MDSKWKNLVIIILVIIIVASAYIFLFSTKDFSQEYSEFSSIWKSKGLNSDYYHLDFESLVNLSESNLEQLKNSFEEKSNSSQGAIKIVSSSYSKLTEIALLAKKNDVLQKRIDSQSDVCDSLNEQRQIHSNYSVMENVYAGYSQKVNFLKEKYPSEAEQINFGLAETGTFVISLDLGEMKSLVELMEGACS